MNDSYYLVYLVQSLLHIKRKGPIVAQLGKGLVVNRCWHNPFITRSIKFQLTLFFQLYYETIVVSASNG
jgi:hypothetical protein